jgi:L-alanine-DL-glutamate epimerase-like enolase superfamily enzyme
MKIAEVRLQTFRYRSRTVRDAHGHGHPGEEHEATQSLFTITTDDGATGHALGSLTPAALRTVNEVVVGEDPFFHERIWHHLKERQRLNLGSLPDRVLTVVDLALWDLVGRVLGQPVHRLLGATRESVPAYASTMVGDDLPGGLDTPESYAKYAEWCVRERGYPAFKLHTWQPPLPGAPSVRHDLEACAAVREAVGPEVPLMLDPFHYYSRLEALELAKGLEELKFLWMEEPMDEHSMSSYVWLCEQTSLPICGPETAEGKMFSRAEWIRAGACDMVRAGVGDVGGITPLVKIAHLAEAFGMNMEVHGNGVGNLHVLCAMGTPGLYYERGLLHPFIDYDAAPAWLNSPVDPMDEHGMVHVSSAPGLGLDLNYDYIRDNTVD